MEVWCDFCMEIITVICYAMNRVFEYADCEGSESEWMREKEMHDRLRNCVQVRNGWGSSRK